jgi:hypothetical protein
MAGVFMRVRMAGMDRPIWLPPKQALLYALLFSSFMAVAFFLFQTPLGKSLEAFLNKLLR